MSVVSRDSRSRIGWPLLVIVGLVGQPISASCSEVDAQWFPLRSHNPFLQGYGLPPFRDGTLAAEGETKYSLSLDIANHADAGQTATESITIDGESYFLAMALRFGAAHWLELGIDLPFVAHADGFLDNAIEGWHDLWGISNTRRNGPGNQLNFLYENQAFSSYELTSRSFGIGDVQLTAAIPLRSSSDHALALRSSLKIPTGEKETLRGSGAFDFSLGIYASNFATFSERDLRFSGFAGVLIPGKGNLFPELQRHAVAFGGIGASWWMTDQFSIAAQTYVQGAYLNSDLDEIGGSSVQLALGGTYRFPGRRVTLALALVEDVFSDATADVALHISVRGYGGNQGLLK